MRRLSYCFILFGFLFLFACATDSGVEENTAATMNPTSSQPQYPAYGGKTASQPQYPAYGGKTAAIPQNNTSLINANKNMMQQQNMQQQMMQQQMMQQMQQNMMKSPSIGGGSFGNGRTMGGGVPR